MAITATLVHAGHNRLRYLLSSTSTGTDTGVITTTGAATPDIKTDLGTNQGPLLAMAKVITQGYGQFAAGAQTQAKARALWLSDRSGANPAPGATGGYDIVATAVCRLTPRDGIGNAWFVDANVNAGNPEITLQVIASADAGDPAECYLDIYGPDTIGD